MNKELTPPDDTFDPNAEYELGPGFESSVWTADFDRSVQSGPNASPGNPNCTKVNKILAKINNKLTKPNLTHSQRAMLGFKVSHIRNNYGRGVCY